MEHSKEAMELHRMQPAGSFDTIEQWSQFVTAFENATLPALSWTHRAHLTVALWYVMHHDCDTALAMLRVRIRRYNEAIGIENTQSSGYHESLTRIFAMGIANFLSQRKDPPLSLLSELLESELADEKWPLRFYTRERINSAEARRNWLEPDLHPAPDPNKP
jgi:hypothetical protein